MTSYSNSEIPLIPGEIYGMRGFTVNDDGTLSPLHRNTSMRYGTGIHTAKCHITGIWSLQFNNSSFTFNISEDNAPVMHKDKPAPVLNCTCGFYGYFDQQPDISFMHGGLDNHVNGIVRASGRAIVGDLGFRAEKMEIVGLVCDYNKKASWKQRFTDFMMDISSGIATMPWKYLVTFLAMYWATLILQIIFDDTELVAVLFNAMSLIVWSYVIVQLSSLAFLVRTVKSSSSDTLRKPPIRVSNKIKKQYPGVKFFSTLEEARAHFPLTKASDLPQ